MAFVHLRDIDRYKLFKEFGVLEVFANERSIKLAFQFYYWDMGLSDVVVRNKPDRMFLFELVFDLE